MPGMQETGTLIVLGLGTGIGFLLCWLWIKRRTVSKFVFDQIQKDALTAQIKLQEESGERQHLKQKLEQTQSEFQTAREQVAILETEKKALIKQMDQRQTDLAEFQEKVKLQFENLANQIFTEKSTVFKQQSQDNMLQLLIPLKEKIQEFQKKIEDSFGTQAKEQFALKSEIERIVKINERMTLEAENLTKALKGDVKAQGNWGEIILERILEESGLQKGRDYILQGEELGLINTDGGRMKPDVVVYLPEKKHIIVDSKVSLTHYERYCGDGNPDTRAVHLKQYLLSLKTHVNGLEQRRYQDTELLGTPDFVLMFLPIEGAYSLAIQQDPELHAYAWNKKIVMVCPATLFATLRTIASVWRLELQNRNTLEIARRGGALYDKIAGFVEEFQKVGRQLKTVNESYENAFNKLSDGKGNILRQAEILKDLGAKTFKSLPKELLINDGQDTDAELQIGTGESTLQNATSPPPQL